jgi:long-chain acyl-CoA synthetase
MSNSIAHSKTITEAYLRRLKADPDKVGFRYKKNGEWKDVTFSQHFETVRRLSCGLMHLGFKKGDRANILAATSIAWSQFDLAILCAGGITVPIYPTNTPEDTQYIINHAETTFLFVDDFKNLQKIVAIGKDCPKLKYVIVNFEVRSEDLKAPFEIIHWNTLYDMGLNHEGALSAKVEALMAEAKIDDIFTICYTSGTTGQPKGVVLTHRSMQAVMIDVDKVIGPYAGADEILLTFLPMSHIFGKWESMNPYYMGWCCSFAESVETLVSNLTEVRPTIWVAVPRVFEKVYAKIIAQVSQSSAAQKKVFDWAVGVGTKAALLRSAGKRPGLVLAAELKLAHKLVLHKVSSRFGGRLKLCVSGLAPTIQMFMHAVGVPVYEGYGLTETCAPICVNVPDANKFGSVGKLMPEVLVRIAEDGEILIKSAKNFQEYYKNPEATAEAIKDGWFYSGDIGHLDEDGFLKITDRKKDLIKTAGGKYIAPQKIENIAKSENMLSQIVIYGDQKPFASCLLTLNQEAVIQYAQSNSILYGEYEELLKNPKIQAVVSEAMGRVNNQLAKYETVKKWIVLPQEFTVESGDLTPSMKIKRKQICTKFKDQLEALYSK